MNYSCGDCVMMCKRDHNVAVDKVCDAYSVYCTVAGLCNGMVRSKCLPYMLQCRELPHFLHCRTSSNAIHGRVEGEAGDEDAGASSSGGSSGNVVLGRLISGVEYRRPVKSNWTGTAGRLLGCRSGHCMLLKSF